MHKRTWMSLTAFLMLGASLAWAATLGDLDTTFDGDGVVLAADGAWVVETAVQADGKVVVAGSLHASQLSNGGNGWLLRRYTNAGAVDAGFGTGGEAEPFDGIGGAGGIADMLLDGSDRILAGGEALVEVAVQTGKGKNKTWTTELQRKCVVIRMTSGGALDATFGEDGIVVLDPDGLSLPSVSELALQSDGRIVVLGSGTASSGRKKKGSSGQTPNNVLFVARLETDGTLDDGFGDAGYSTKDLGIPVAVAVQSDDAIVVGSRATDEPGGGAWALHRYDADGTFDASFGALLDPGANFFGLSLLAIDASDRILAAGIENDGGDIDSVVVRYSTSGALDSSFGTSGIAHAAIGQRNHGDGGLAVDPDGAILLSGTIVTETTPPDHEAYLLRFTSGGVLDGSFGPAGRGEALPGTDPTVGMTLSLAPTGEIVVAGIVDDFVDESNRSMFIARWCGD